MSINIKDITPIVAKSTNLFLFFVFCFAIYFQYFYLILSVINSKDIINKNPVKAINGIEIKPNSKNQDPVQDIELPEALELQLIADWFGNNCS